MITDFEYYVFLLQRRPRSTSKYGLDALSAALERCLAKIEMRFEKDFYDY